MILSIIELHLLVGLIIYSIFLLRDAIQGFPRLAKADVVSVLRGLTVIAIWPYILWHMEIK